MNGFAWSAFGVNLAGSALAALTVLMVTFLIGRAKGTHRVVDIAWGAAFAAVALVTLALSAGQGDVGRRLLVVALTVVWGLRLSAHIAWRSRGAGEDPRYARMLSRAPGSRDAYAFRMVYLLQGALVWVISLPVQAACYLPAEVGPLVLVGVLLWATGLFFEAVGDWQMARFKADSAHRGQIMDRGLWRYTRHPNYFGDFLVWWGLFLIAAGSWALAAMVVLSPLVMSYLLIFGSGKRLLERDMARRPGFAEYASRTSGFLPLPPRKA